MSAAEEIRDLLERIDALEQQAAALHTKVKAVKKSAQAVLRTVENESTRIDDLEEEAREWRGRAEDAQFAEQLAGDIAGW